MLYASFFLIANYVFGIDKLIFKHKSMCIDLF